MVKLEKLNYNSLVYVLCMNPNEEKIKVMQSIATSGTEYDNRKNNVTISTTSFIISPYTTAVTIAVAHKP